MLQPLVLVFEDVHWAEEPLLDLIEHLARSLRDAPVLIVALARPGPARQPSLLGWRHPQRERDRARSPRRQRQRGARGRAAEPRPRSPPAQRALVLERAEGNPLFLEEIAHALRDGRGIDRIPDSVQALIAARIDGLDAGEKQLLAERRARGSRRLAGRARIARPGARGRRAPRPARRARVPRPRGAVDDLGRRRLPLQARADPRRRVRRHEQGAARGGASCVRRLGGRTCA